MSNGLVRNYIHNSFRATRNYRRQSQASGTIQVMHENCRNACYARMFLQLMIELSP